MQLKKYVLGLIAVSALFAACNDEDEMTQSRIFRPIEITMADTGNGFVDFEWYASKDASSYEVQISESENFAEGVTNTYNTANKTLRVTDGVAITSTDLDSLYVRIRAFSALEGIGDSEYLDPIKFAPYRENIFSTIKKEDQENTRVLIRWKTSSTGDVDKLILRDINGSTIQEVAVSMDDYQYLFENLKPITTYNVAIYDNGKRRGKVEFTTRSSNEVIVTSVDEFLDQLKNIEEGWTIRVKPLAEGAPYEFTSTVNIAKSVSIESAADNSPVLLMPSGISLRGQLGKVAFRDIIIKGDNSSGNNAINLAKAGDESIAFTGIDSLVISGCTISDYNKALICYGAPDTPSFSLYMDNCIVHDINAGGTAGAQAIDLRDDDVKTIKITNSTFYNMGRSFIRAAKGNGQTFELANCTFYNTSASSQSFIDFNNGSTGKYTISNNIFSTITGKGYTLPQDKVGDVTGPAANATLEYSYNCTSNVKFTSNATAQWHINEGNRADTDPMFADPANGDFTLNGSSPCLTGGKRGSMMGDPRWKKK